MQLSTPVKDDCRGCKRNGKTTCRAHRHWRERRGRSPRGRKQSDLAFTDRATEAQQAAVGSVALLIAVVSSCRVAPAEAHS